MKKFKEDSKLILKGKSYSANDVISVVMCLPGLTASEILLKHNFLLPKHLRMDVLKEVLYPQVREIINATLTIADERKYRLSWFKTYSEFQLENLLATFKDDNLNYEYLKLLWDNILSYMIEKKANDAVILELISESNKVEQKITNNIMRYNLALAKVFVDKPGEFDGLAPETLRPVLYKSATVAEIRELGKKYDLVVPQRLKKNEFLELILDDLRNTGRYKKSIEEELAKMTITQLQRFCINNKMKLSIDLKKESVIEYILGKADNKELTYYKPSDNAVYGVELSDLGIDPDSYFRQESIFNQDEKVVGTPLYEKITIPTKQTEKTLVKLQEDIVLKSHEEEKPVEPKEQVVVEKIIIKKDKEEPKKEEVITPIVTHKVKEETSDKNLLLAYVDIRKKLKNIAIDIDRTEVELKEISNGNDPITQKDIAKYLDLINKHEKQVNDATFEIEEAKLKFEGSDSSKAIHSESEINRLIREELSRVRLLYDILSNLSLYSKSMEDTKIRLDQEAKRLENEKDNRHEEELRRKELELIREKEEATRQEEAARLKDEQLRREKEEALKRLEEEQKERIRVIEEEKEQRIRALEAEKEEALARAKEAEEAAKANEPKGQVKLMVADDDLDFGFNKEETRVEVTDYSKQMQEQKAKREEAVQESLKEDRERSSRFSKSDDFYAYSNAENTRIIKPVIVDPDASKPVPLEEKGVITEEESIESYWDYKTKKKRKSKEQILKEKQLEETIYQDETQMLTAGTHRRVNPKPKKEEGLTFGQKLVVATVLIVAILLIAAAILHFGFGNIK